MEITCSKCQEKRYMQRKTVDPLCIWSVWGHVHIPLNVLVSCQIVTDQKYPTHPHAENCDVCTFDEELPTNNTLLLCKLIPRWFRLVSLPL